MLLLPPGFRAGVGRGRAAGGCGDCRRRRGRRWLRLVRGRCVELLGDRDGLPVGSIGRPANRRGRGLVEVIAHFEGVLSCDEFLVFNSFSLPLRRWTFGYDVFGGRQVLTAQLRLGGRCQDRGSRCWWAQRVCSERGQLAILSFKIGRGSQACGPRGCSKSE